MDLYEVIWKSQYVEKLVVKHLVSTTEVEEVLFKQPFTSAVLLKFAGIHLACGAGDSIKPGVERSATPG